MALTFATQQAEDDFNQCLSDADTARAGMNYRLALKHTLCALHILLKEDNTSDNIAEMKRLQDLAQTF
jgi:hypothetical protein